MNLRASELVPLAEWLDRRLQGAAIQGVRVPGPDTVVLSLRQPAQTAHLLVSVQPGWCRFHTVPRPPPNPDQPFALQGLLRKELSGRIEGISMPGGDRVLRIDLGPRVLIAVLYGSAADLLLLDADGEVLGSARRSHTRGSVWKPTAPPSGPESEDRFAGLDGAARDEAIRARFEEEAADQRRTNLRRRLTARRKGLARRASKQETESDRGETASDLQRQGDLLQSAFGRLRRGMAEVEVPDFYDGGTRRIELDPARDAAENLDRLYARARKARRAGEEAGRRLLETLDELEGLDEALRRLDEEPSADLDELLPKRGKRQRRRDEPRLPYRIYRTPSGAEIRVGRGARDNDDLTFRHSKGNDVWLHVRSRPGAHVVIRAPGPHPTPELLVVAAQVALLHSGIKPGAREEVAWTRVKHVRKPKGLAPGKVMPSQVKVLYVEADPEVVAGLARE